MLPDERTIQSRSISVYKALSRKIRCTFAELQNLCKMGSTELCLGIARLMQEHKIKEERLDGNVYYSICY